MIRFDGQKYDQEYLNGIKENAFKRMDSAGNGDGKITTDEAFKDLDIGSLLLGQNAEDSTKIMGAAQNIGEVISEYAGEDGEFTAEEWADFLNGDEWGNVLDAWHSSGSKAKLEMGWIDNAHIKDGITAKGEVKVGILNHLEKQGIDIQTMGLEAIIDKYAGDDGTFNLEEYRNLKNDPLYHDFIDKYNVAPWFSIED